MAQLVEGDLVDLRALERLLEAADELRAVERLAGLGMAEDEVAIACVEGALRAARASATATRSAIGTERPEPADFGSPNSPRT